MSANALPSSRRIPAKSARIKVHNRRFGGTRETLPSPDSDSRSSTSSSTSSSSSASSSAPLAVPANESHGGTTTRATKRNAVFASAPPPPTLSRSTREKRGLSKMKPPSRFGPASRSLARLKTRKHEPKLPAIREDEEESEQTLCPRGEDVARVALVQGSAALHAYANLKTDPVTSMACIPVIVPFSMPYENIVDFFPLSDRATKFQKTLVVLTMTQGTLSLVQLLLGDLLGGFLGGVMAATGSYATSPQGIPWLPTYTVLSFLNGSVGALGLMEKVVFSKFAFLSFANPLPINLVHAVVLFAPLCSFAGVYYAHGFLKELRMLHANGSVVDTSIEAGAFSAAAMNRAGGQEAGASSSSGVNLQETGLGAQRGPHPSNLVPFSGRPHTITSSGED
eukprot:g3838.t1